MSGLSDATAANGVLDARHLDLLRRYRDAMRDLLSLSRAEYAPRPADEDDEDPNEDPNEDNEDDDVGPPLTPSSVLYASLVVAPTRRAFSWAVPTREALAAVERHSGGHLLEMGAGTGLWTALLRARGSIERIDAVDVAPCDGANINGHHAVFSRTLANPPPFATVRVGIAHENARSWRRTGLSIDDPSSNDKNERGSASTGVRPSEFESESESEPREQPRALLLCWPPREEPGADVPAEVSLMARSALARFRGDAVLYVGEAPEPDGDEASRNACGATAGPAFHAELLAGWRRVESVPLPRWPGAADSLTVWRRRAREAERDADVRHSGHSGESDLEPLEPLEPLGADLSPPRRLSRWPTNDAEAASAPRTETDDARAETAMIEKTNQYHVSPNSETRRRALLREAREAWESATVAGIAARASRGGARAMRGAEQTALRAVRERSGAFRRLALAFL